MHYRFPTLFIPILFYCLLAMIALISINHDNQLTSAEIPASSNTLDNQSANARSTASNKTSAYNETASSEILFISVHTDAAKYTKGHDVIIFGNVSDANGTKESKVVRVEISQLGVGRPETSTSLFAENGLFYFKAPDIGLGMKNTTAMYNVTAEIEENRAKGWTSFEVSDAETPLITIAIGILSLGGFLYLLLKILPYTGTRKYTSGGSLAVTRLNIDDIYNSEVIRFITLSGIALTPFTMFIYYQWEYGLDNPIGLVKESSKSNGLMIEWVINVGGSESDNYSKGLQIPFYVVVLGIAGGYLAYLVKAAFKLKKSDKSDKSDKSEHVPPDITPDTTRQRFMQESIAELSEIILAPFLAIGAWFLLSISGNPNVYTIGAVSFTVGLATKRIIERFVGFVGGAIENSEGKNKNDLSS